MIISSERKYDKCPHCGGSGKVSEHGTFPWMPDTTSSCHHCSGSGKKETNKYNYDKNIINISNVVTLGEICIDDHFHGFSGSEHVNPFARFYINGHIKIEEYGNELSINDPNYSEKHEKENQRVYLKLKKIRDNILEKIKKDC